MEGARWDLTSGGLCESRQRQLYDSLPVVAVLPDVRRSTAAKDTTEGLIVTDNEAAETGNIEMQNNTSEISHNKLESTATTTEIALATTRPTTYHYSCPVYQTSARRGILSTSGHCSNYVFDLSLPSWNDPDTWVLRGSAALLQVDQ